MKRVTLIFLFLSLMVYRNVLAGDSIYWEDNFDDEEEIVEVYDPIEPINRVFFSFNDLIHKVLKPLSKVYGNVVADDVRQTIKNAWTNLTSPVRIFNNVLQGNVNGAGRELKRFIINSTLGVAGFGDPAKVEFGIKKSNEDFGQTLAHWGVGDGVYLVLPILGPTTLRDGVGLAVDGFLIPQNHYAQNDDGAAAALYMGDAINSISICDPYDEITKDAFEPYTAVRNAYMQNRRNKITNKDNPE